ncbi:hypothetical protein [Streptomyces sp. NPDC088789]|uniref:hypothetical protein n=1 Tax=Streptomyces sp. NPDC088789 TaxID=3365899 RepID=UPI0037F335AC
MNDIKSMRNINLNLFDGLPMTADALDEYDSQAAQLVREAANQLYVARRTGNDTTAVNEASRLTFQAAAVLLDGAGRSVYVRFPIMITARLVELEAALLAAQAQNTTAGDGGVA